MLVQKQEFQLPSLKVVTDLLLRNSYDKVGEYSPTELSGLNDRFLGNKDSYGEVVSKYFNEFVNFVIGQSDFTISKAKPTKEITARIASTTVLKSDVDEDYESDTVEGEIIVSTADERSMSNAVVTTYEELEEPWVIRYIENMMQNFRRSSANGLTDAKVVDLELNLASPDGETPYLFEIVENNNEYTSYADYYEYVTKLHEAVYTLQRASQAYKCNIISFYIRRLNVALEPGNNTYGKLSCYKEDWHKCYIYYTGKWRLPPNTGYGNVDQFRLGVELVNRENSRDEVTMALITLRDCCDKLSIDLNAEKAEDFIPGGRVYELFDSSVPLVDANAIDVREEILGMRLMDEPATRVASKTLFELVDETIHYIGYHVIPSIKEHYSAINEITHAATIEIGWFVGVINLLKPNTYVMKNVLDLEFIDSVLYMNDFSGMALIPPYELGIDDPYCKCAVILQSGLLLLIHNKVEDCRVLNLKNVYNIYKGKSIGALTLGFYNGMLEELECS